MMRELLLIDTYGAYRVSLERGLTIEVMLGRDPGDFLRRPSLSDFRRRVVFVGMPFYFIVAIY